MEITFEITISAEPADDQPSPTETDIQTSVAEGLKDRGFDVSVTAQQL